MPKVVLVVDDVDIQRRVIAAPLLAAGYEVLEAASGGAAVDILLKGETHVDVVLLDLNMPGMSGVEVLNTIRPKKPSLPMIMLTADNAVETVVKVMRAGATDFIPKPASPERLKAAVENTLRTNSGTGEINRGKRRWKGRLTFDDLIGNSPAMIQAIELAKKGAAANIPILIEGESGVGKEMFARAIQGSSERADKPFVTVNCGAIPANLVESILFGHEKGAFTGATERHDGKFVEANGGTLFLDEIGELPLDTQVKLLRAIQEGEVDPVGGRKPVKVDIRLISATNRTLIERVRDGNFREDLLYRLNVFPIRIPPLRERREDIALMAAHFATTLAESEGKTPRPLTQRALDMLTRYDWPGNVRQLENAVFRAVILAEGSELDINDFPQILTAMSGKEANGASKPAVPGLETPLMADADLRLTQDGHLRPLADIEADIIRLALERYDGHMSEVARRLGIGRSTLYRKVSELGLEGFPHAITGGRLGA
jgi:DNA-binding NtrC family response regulator